MDGQGVEQSPEVGSCCREGNAEGRQEGEGGKKTTPRGMRTEKEMKERAEFALVLKENMFTLSDTECENKVQKEITTRTKV